jgi:hypothetical protein
MNHPAYNPDLAPCDLFLFGAIKENFAGIHFATASEPFQGVEDFLSTPFRLFLLSEYGD